MARQPKPIGRRDAASNNRYRCCRSGKDLLAAARTHPRFSHVQPGKGSHQRVVTVDGQVSAPIPVHPGDVGVGLRRAIVRSLLAVGLGAAVVAPFLLLLWAAL